MVIVIILTKVIHFVHKPRGQKLMVYFVAKFALKPYPPSTLIDANLGKNHLIDF